MLNAFEYRECLSMHVTGYAFSEYFMSACLGVWRYVCIRAYSCTCNPLSDCTFEARNWYTDFLTCLWLSIAQKHSVCHWCLRNFIWIVKRRCPRPFWPHASYKFMSFRCDHTFTRYMQMVLIVWIKWDRLSPWVATLELRPRLPKFNLATYIWASMSAIALWFMWCIKFKKQYLQVDIDKQRGNNIDKQHLRSTAGRSDSSHV